jgi:hypothetical protein
MVCLPPKLEYTRRVGSPQLPRRARAAGACGGDFARPRLVNEVGQARQFHRRGRMMFYQAVAADQALRWSLGKAVEVFGNDDQMVLKR